MCFSVKKRKYTYLSMCSCCNVVSKYPATVKKHIQTQHIKRGVVKGIKSRVIPIRIENRFENDITRTLDNGNSNRKFTEKCANPFPESDNSFHPTGMVRVGQKKNKNAKKPKSRDRRTLKCSICNTHSDNRIAYIKHVVALHCDRNIKINFQCLVCSDVFMFYTDIQNHFKETHSEVSSMGSFIDSLNIKIHKASSLLKQIQCPYCDQLFPELGLLHQHVEVLHSDNTGKVLIKCDSDEKKIFGTTAEIILTKYSCPSCGKCFHTLLDLREHCLAQHSSSIANSKSARKRKPPKWLQSEDSHVTVKKQKTSLISKQIDRKKSTDLLDEKLGKSKYSDSHMKDCQSSAEGSFEFKEVKVEVMKDEKVEEMKEEKVKTTNEISGKKKVSLPSDADGLDFDEVDSDFPNDFGDSSDDFVPGQSDSDSDESVKGKYESLDSIVEKHKKSKQLKSAKSGGKKKEDKEKHVNKYKCQFCEFYLYHHEYIRSHVQLSHPEVTNYRIVTKKMKLNSCDNNWESFKCQNPKCKYTSEKKATLQVHIADCRNGKFKNEKIDCHLPKTWMEKLENTVSLICFHCDDIVQGKIGYENHLREHFPDKTFEVQLSSTLPPPQIQNKKSKRLKAAALKEVECSMCPYCEVVTTQKAQLSKHFKRFHSNESSSSVIFCVLANQSSVKETAKLIVKDVESDKSDTGNFSESGVENVSSCKQVASRTSQLNNDVLCKDRWSEIQQYVNIQSTVPIGIYICPLCNDFKTHVKKDIKVHMDEHNRKTEEDVDSVFVIPDKWLKLDVKDRKLQCQFCDFTTDLNLTLGFRHILACHKDVTVNELDQASSPLFKMLNVRIEGAIEKYEKQKYKCTTCVPGFIFKTKKGLQLHLKTNHTDPDSLVVYESMYQMMDLIADSCDTGLVYACSLCSDDVLAFTKSDFKDHFHAEHPEHIPELVKTLINTSEESTGPAAEQTKCEVCEKHFIDSESLKHHLILHVNRFKPTCDLCDLCFTNKAELETHNRDVHFSSGEMCYKCGVMYPNTSALMKHVKTHNEPPKGMRRTLCQYCGTSVMAKNMNKHLVDKHIELMSCDCDICSTQTAPEWKKAYKCDLCDAVFCTWYYCRGHKHKEHNYDKRGMLYTCRRCNETFSNRKDHSIHSHKCGKDDEYLQSSINFDEDSLLENNVNMTEITVTEEASIDFSYGLAHVRQKYIQVNQNAEKPFSCKLCSSTFTKVSYVYNHLRRMHTRDETKRLRCKVCKMGFVGKKEFETHCRTHIGLRPYQCSICQKRYKTLGHLKEHSQLHVSGYLYSCGYCGLEFNQRGALLAHVVHHDKLKPFKCLYCEKGYTTHGDLQRHMVNYSKQSKFAGTKKLTFCDYCCKDFANHNALVKHFQVHLPVTPFECAVCQEKFSSFRQMYTHKSKKKHFTDTDKEAGKMDLQAPGRKFRRYQVSKRRIDTDKERKRNHNEELENELAPGNTLNVFSNNRNVIKIQIDGTGAENDDVAKVVLQEFESEVIKSMLDADPEVLKGLEFHGTHSDLPKENQAKENREENVVLDSFQYEIPEGMDYHTDYAAMPNMYEADKSNAFVNTGVTTETTSVGDKIEELVCVGTENEEAQQQAVVKTFRMSEGSSIRVFVFKPDK